jgi:tetratricopeptide (TPR) repeat protein
VNLKPEEAFVLSRVDGTQTAKDIFALSPLSEEMTARTLVGLLQADLIEPEGVEPPKEKARSPQEAADTREASPPPAPELDAEQEEVERLFRELPSKNHWEVLGIKQGSSLDDIQQAFFRGAKRFHPDRFRRIPSPEFQEKVSYVFRRFTEANEILTSSARSGYEALADKERQYEASRSSTLPTAAGRGRPAGNAAEAEALVRRAQQAYEASDFWNAIQLCHQAIDQAPERAEAYHLLGLALAKNPKWRQDAEKNLRIATNLDPWKADYFLALGSLYLDVGLHLRARKAFEQAKAVDPGVKVPDV